MTLFKHDGCLFIFSLKQWILDIVVDFPYVNTFFLCTDCSSKEFKSTPNLAKIQQLSDELGYTFLVTQWGRLKGKWLYDSSGKRWEVRYKNHDVDITHHLLVFRSSMK